MWKKNLNTDEDPSNNGRWNTSGANGDSIGLYGGLTDSIDTAATFDQANQHYSPTQRLAASSIIDNRNGLASSSSVTLQYQYSDTVSTTHTVSNSVKAGVAFEFKAAAEIFGIGGDATTKFSIDYTYTSTDATTSTQTRTETVSQNVTVTPPTGKVYKAVLLGSAQQIDVPYKVNIHVTGTTETWFEDRVNGHYNWMMDAGSAFANFNNPAYINSNGGLVTGVSGILTAQQTTDFLVQIWDITNSFSDKPNGGSPQKLVASRQASLLPPGASIVSSVPVTAHQLVGV
jgi:hypothetical protein